MMTLKEFYNELEKHDWYYYFSDDMSVDRRGAANRARLLKVAEDGGEAYKKLWDAYESHMFTGEPWKTPKAPKPEMPSEEYDINKLTRGIP